MLLEKDIGIGNMLVARLKDQRVQKVGDLTSIISLLVFGCTVYYGNGLQSVIIEKKNILINNVITFI